MRATLGRSSGKYYFEVLHNDPDGTSYNIVAGILKIDGVLTTYPGDNLGGYGFMGNGRHYINGNIFQYGLSWDDDGDVVGVAVDLDNNKIYFRRNGVWETNHDPVAGTGGHSIHADSTYYPAASAYIAEGGSTVTGRFASSDFSDAPPTGYSAWQ